MLTFKRFNLILILIFLSIGINDFFVMSFMKKMMGSDNYLWIFRICILTILILFGLKDYLSYLKIKYNYAILVSLITFTILISSYNSFIFFTDFTKNLLGHFFYIYIIFFLLQTKEIINNKTIEFIGLLLILLGLLSSLSYILIGGSDAIRNPAGVYLNVINFPTYGFIGLLIVAQKRVYIFYLVITIILTITYLEINRTLFLAAIIFYLISQKKDLGIFKIFSYSTWIILSLIATLIIGIIEFDQLTTTSFSTGRGQIWMMNWIQFINFDFLSALFGSTINYNNNLDIYENYDQINLSLNYFQLHSVTLKTLLDYGIMGFIIVMIIFKNKKQKRFEDSFNLINALFFSCFVIASLNSSTNFIKMDIYGLLMFIALAASNQKSSLIKLNRFGN